MVCIVLTQTPEAGVSLNGMQVLVRIQGLDSSWPVAYGYFHISEALDSWFGIWGSFQVFLVEVV